MVVILGESIGFDHFRIVRNRARFWERCLELFYGIAEVFCSAVLRVIEARYADLRRSPGASRLLGSIGCEEVSRSDAQKSGTSQKQGCVLPPRSLLRRPIPRSI